MPEPCHQLLHFHHVANEGGTRKFEKIGLENMECSSARPNTRNLAKLEQLPAHCHRGGGGVPTPNVLRQNGTRFCIFTMWPMKVKFTKLVRKTWNLVVPDQTHEI